MAFQNELRRGLTAEEAVLVFLKADKKYDSLREHWREVYEDYAMDGKTINNVVQLDGSSYLERLIKMFSDEIKIACAELSAKEGGRLETKITTPIKLLFENDFDKTISNIEMTKKSIAMWLQSFEPNKSILFDPTESYFLEDDSGVDSAKNDPFGEDGMNPNFFSTLSVYKNCWKDLPSDMSNPNKTELKEYIKSTTPIRDNNQIEAMIVLSSPDGYMFRGGKKTNKLIPWRPLKKR